MVEQADYLGVVLGALVLWMTPQPADINLHRAQLSFAKPLRRMEGRIVMLEGVQQSITQRSPTWTVYVLPLLSYVAQYCWLYAPLLAQVVRLLARHMRCSWWLSVAHLQCLRVWTGKSMAPQSISAVCAGYYISRWCRQREGQWWYTLHESSGGGRACDAVLASLRWVNDGRCSREAAKVLEALGESATNAPWRWIGRAVRTALDEQHAAEQESDMLRRFVRWPLALLSPVSCLAYRHPRHTYQHIFTMFCWLCNAVPTGRRRRHWISTGLRALKCELCSCEANVLPVTVFDETGVCRDHLMDFTVDCFEGSGWRAFVALTEVATRGCVVGLEPDGFPPHAVARALSEAVCGPDRAPTVASLCAGCGLSDDSLEHRLFVCPVIGMAWEVAFGEAGVTWTGRAALAISLLAFFHAMHLWFAARSHLDPTRVEKSMASWHRNSQSLLQSWWDSLPPAEKAWEVASRLLRHGVRLSGSHGASSAAVPYAAVTGVELRALRAVSHAALAVAQAMQGAAEGIPSPCEECLRFWASASGHSIVSMRVGPGLVAAAGCLDYRMRRWAVSGRADAGSPIYAWLSHPSGSCYAVRERPALMVRTVRLGCDYTIQVAIDKCVCGWERRGVHTARELAAGTELVGLGTAAGVSWW